MTGGDARVSTRRGDRAVRAKRRTRGGFVAIKMVGPIPDARNFQRGTAFHDISRPISGVEGEAGMGKVLLLLLSRDISNKRIPPFSSVLTFRPASSESLLLVIQGLKVNEKGYCLEFGNNNNKVGESIYLLLGESRRISRFCFLLPLKFPIEHICFYCRINSVLARVMLINLIRIPLGEFLHVQRIIQ